MADANRTKCRHPDLSHRLGFRDFTTTLARECRTRPFFSVAVCVCMCERERDHRNRERSVSKESIYKTRSRACREVKKALRLLFTAVYSGDNEADAR